MPIQKIHEPPPPVLSEGEHLMRVTEVSRLKSAVSKNAYWRVKFEPVRGDPTNIMENLNATAYICYSEHHEASWKIKQDAGSIDGIKDMLGREYLVMITHEMWEAELRMRATIVHAPRPRSVIEAVAELLMAIAAGDRTRGASLTDREVEALKNLRTSINVGTCPGCGSVNRDERRTIGMGPTGKPCTETWHDE